MYPKEYFYEVHTTYVLYIIYAINLIFIGQGVDYWGCESHSKPTLSHFRVNIILLKAQTLYIYILTQVGLNTFYSIGSVF